MSVIMFSSCKIGLRCAFAGMLFLSAPCVHGLVSKPNNPLETHHGAKNSTDEVPLALLDASDANGERRSVGVFDTWSSSFARYWQKLKTVVGGDEDVLECPQLSLNPDSKKLALRMRSGPVYANPKSVQASIAHSPHHVFISGPAHGGTTAVYNLVGTSPMTSNLCAAKTICCEGSWLLLKRGLMEYSKRFYPEYPPDWNEALNVFSEYWNTSKKVLIEKSPESLSKFTHIFRDLNATGKRVSFIYVTRSPCYPPDAHVRFAPRMHELTHQIDDLKSAGARVLVIRMEDLEHDPYETARAILEFVPELQSLDPTMNSIDSEEVKFEGGERAIPIAQFAASRDFNYGRRHGKIVHSTAEDRSLMRKLGYPERLVQR